MKILVYGAGVLGCNLARNLLRAGKDVTLLARGNWAAEIRRNGLRIKDKFSPCVSVSCIPVVTELASDAVYPCLRRTLLRLRVQKEKVTDDEEEGNLSFP